MQLKIAMENLLGKIFEQMDDMIEKVFPQRQAR